MKAPLECHIETTETISKAATATVIDSPDRAEALAEHLLDPTRSKPVVLVTTATGQSRPFLDVDSIIDAISSLADVYVLATGSITRALSHRLPEKTQVYGGAGRVYPVNKAWQSNPYAAPLRFAWGPSQGKVATDTLIADAMRAAHAAGLDTGRVGATVVQVQGAVKALSAPARAWVRTDDRGDAAIWQDLLVPGVALDRAFQLEMRVSGGLDVQERRMDVSASLRKPAEALAGYAVGAVVLGRVVELGDSSAVVELYPGMRTAMSANELTGDPNDTLTALMSVGEVLAVRVTARGGHDGRGWQLSTVDVEDFEEILAASSLLPGGPPWLVMARVAPQGPVAAPPRAAARQLAEGSEQSETLPVDARDLCPALLTSLAGEEAAATPSLAEADVNESLRRQITQMNALLLESRKLEHAFEFERDEFREQTRESYARVQQLVRSAEKGRTDLRLEKQKSQRLEKQARSARVNTGQGTDTDVLFLDPVEQFRYEVDVAYAHRIPAADKAARPRREVRIGPDFLASLGSVDGVGRSKVVAVTVEIITDLVNELDSRDLHPLREGCGGAERDVVRPGDGARCMRVALQRNTPSARRLHYWKVGEAIELSRVVKHDDMTP